MIAEMIESHLRENGFDGLYNDAECACELGDLFPCNEIFPDCMAGYKSPCTGIHCGADGDCDFHIGPKRGDA